MSGGIRKLKKCAVVLAGIYGVYIGCILQQYEPGIYFLLLSEMLYFIDNDI